MPEERLAPAGLPANLKREARIAAVIAAVVVLPFVAEMMAEPCSSRAASRAMPAGLSAFSTRPGRVVPPPLPLRREAVPTARATRVLITSGIRTVVTSLQYVLPSDA
jgi:hypothetical protein